MKNGTTINIEIISFFNLFFHPQTKFEYTQVDFWTENSFCLLPEAYKRLIFSAPASPAEGTFILIPRGDTGAGGEMPEALRYNENHEQFKPHGVPADCVSPRD